MGLRGIKPELVKKRLKAFFYGMAGTGKTFTSIQFPSPYLIDTERGAENKKYVEALKKSGGMIYQTADFEELMKEVKSLLTEKHEYKTLIIDPLTTLYNDLIDKAGIKHGTDFGRHYGEANKRMKHLLNLLLRLDMNVIITSHAKTEYGQNMSVLGQTFDCYKKLDYLFDLVFEIQKRGKERFAVVKKTRLDGFPDTESFPFSYEEVAQRYGKDELERVATSEKLASPEQVKEILRLIDLMKLPEEVWKKYLEKGNSEKWEEMPFDAMTKSINYLNLKIKGAE
jgi:hypothetical protein